MDSGLNKGGSDFNKFMLFNTETEFGREKIIDPDSSWQHAAGPFPFGTEAKKFTKQVFIFTKMFVCFFSKLKNISCTKVLEVIKNMIGAQT